MYLDGNFFETKFSDSEYFTFLNKNNGLIYLKKGEDYYRQINEDNPFVYVMDNTVSELKDLTSTNWFSFISKNDKEGTDHLYDYIINKLSKFKKPKDNYVFTLGTGYTSCRTDIYINGYREEIVTDELLYVPKRVEDEELKSYSILVVKDEVFLSFSRYLSDGSYEVIYDKDFNVVKEGNFNYDDELWNYLGAL